MTISTLEILGRLLPLKYNGCEVPCQENSTSASNRLVQHAQWGVPGAYVENTGRQPASFEFKIPFRAGIAQYNDLYPERFRKFWNACLDPTPGMLQHPEFGSLIVHVDKWAVNWMPNARDGADMTVSFVETNEQQSSLEAVGSSPIVTAVYIAGNMDSFDKLVLSSKYEDPSATDLLTSLRQIQGMVQMAQMDVARCTAQIEGTISAVNSALDTIASVTDPNQWGLIDSLSRIEAALTETKQKLGSQRKRIAQKLNDKPQSLSTASARFGMTLADFCGLNLKAAGRGGTLMGESLYVFEAG